MSGPDVAEVQRLLGVEDDGQYGPLTAGVVATWKRSCRMADTEQLDPLERRRLLADVSLRAVRLMEHWAAVGVAEEPAGSNNVPELAALAERLEVRPEFSRMGYPWCAFAVFLAALVAGGRMAALGPRRKAFNPLNAPALLAAAKARTFGLALVATWDGFRGDLVLFNWNFSGGDPADHVGRLVAAPAGGRAGR